MGRLIYSNLTSLDGYVADVDGKFDWAEPDAAVHAFVNDRERNIGTHLYGRRLYQVMEVWQTFGDEPDESAEVRDYADIWRSTDKIVFSSTLGQVATPRTTLETAFDPAMVNRLKQTRERHLAIGGPTLAAAAFRAGLVDEVAIFVNPVIVGGGTSVLPDGLRLDLRLTEERRFDNGVVFLNYRVR